MVMFNVFTFLQLHRYKYDGKLYEFIEPPYDNGGKGLRCIGFTGTTTIREEYLKCDTIRKVIPQKKCKSSVKRFSALLTVMQTKNWSIIARYANSDRTMPELMALIPSEDSMLMYELSFNNEIISLSFPHLKRKNKFTPTADQYEFMDKFIDTMDLDKSPEFLKYLQDPAFQQQCNSLAFGVLHPNDELPEKEEDVMALITAPKHLSTDDIEKMKSLFPLTPAEEEKKPHRQWPATSNGNKEDINVFLEPGSSRSGNQQVGEKTKIGTIRPADDFLSLLSRGEPFNELATQIQDILIDFVRKPMITDTTDKIHNGLLAYRGRAKRNAPLQYNRWIAHFKEALRTHKKKEIWKLIVKEKLGLITLNESEKCNVSFEKAQAFYLDELDPQNDEMDIDASNE